MPPTLANPGVLPLWFVLPATVVVMLTVAAAIQVAAKHTVPASRRRVRLANGWVMLLTTPLAAAGFGLIDSATQPRLFVKVWILVIGLISISVILAFMDMLNTARLARVSHQRLRASMRTLSAPIEHDAHRQPRTDDEPASDLRIAEHSRTDHAEPEASRDD